MITLQIHGNWQADGKCWTYWEFSTKAEIRDTTSAIFPRHDFHQWLLRRCRATVAAVL